MAIGSGLGGQVGYAAESTYGTYVAVTRFPEVSKSEVKKVKTTVQGGGLASGRVVQAGGRRVFVAESGVGMIEQEVTNKSMGLLLTHIFGGTVTPLIQGAGPAYLQTHTLVDNVGKSLSVQNGVADTGGTLRPYTGLGGKVTSAEFKCTTTDLLTVGVELDFQKVTEAQTIATASYVSTSPFHGGQMRVKVGTFGAEAAVTGVRGFSLKVERPMDTEMMYASVTSPTVKAQPQMSDFVKITGTLDVDFVTKADFVDRFFADTSTSLVIEFIGPIINATFPETFSLNVTQAFFDGDNPNLDGPGVTKVSIPFVGQFDLTNNPLICKYISTDITV